MRWLPRCSSALAAAVAVLTPALAGAQTKIDFFFPVPVDGKLAREMTRLVKVYNDSQKEVAVTAAYTGSYGNLISCNLFLLRPTLSSAKS